MNRELLEYRITMTIYEMEDLLAKSAVEVINCNKGSESDFKSTAIVIASCMNMGEAFIKNLMDSKSVKIQKPNKEKQ